MSQIFQRIILSPISFWLGLLLGIIILGLLYRLRSYIVKTIRNIYQKITDINGTFKTNAEINLKNDIISFAQKQHIAFMLFPLDEIVVEPTVMLPLIQSSRSVELSPTDIVSLTVPYIPDWPELSALYRAPTISLIEVLQGGGNIILAGNPGSGKTVALARLTIAICKNEAGLGKLAGLIPLYIHATDIPHLLSFTEAPQNIEKAIDLNSSASDYHLQTKKNHVEEVVNLLIRAISKYASPITLTRLERTILSSIESRKVILILDRVDELPPSQSILLAEYIRILLEKYPWFRIVVAMSYDNLANFPLLGFSLAGMASWSNDDRNNLLYKWSQQWVQNITPIDKAHTKKINPNLLKSWLDTNNSILTPLEFTLKIWSGFSGDILGDDGPSAIEAYIRRITGNDSINRRSLEQFALQLLIDAHIAGKPTNNENLLSEYKSAIKSSEDIAPSEGEKTSSQNVKLPAAKKLTGAESFVSDGLLISYPDSNYGFSHPIVFGYLAGKALADYGVIDKIVHQPSWMGRNLAFHFLSLFGDVNNIIQHYLQDDDILHTNHLLIARWLQVAPKNQAWRTIVLRTLATILQKERDTISLSAKILSAMAFSGDKGVSIYFRQLIKSTHPNLKQLAALGCGVLNDINAIDDLSKLLLDPSPSAIRSASLALGAIGDKKSLEILAVNLLNGDESVRRYAAEALANNAKEGYPALQEGSSMEDLLVRRAVIFGLIRVDQPWATKIVENMQLEDKEWVVRNAAIEVFNEQQKRRDYAPTPLPDITEAQWLINYAARSGTTIAPGKPAEMMVEKALNNGTPDEKIYALNYLINKFDPKTIELLASTYKKSSGDLREMTYYLLWLMNLAGISIPFSIE